MHQNSQNLVTHLRQILQLNPNQEEQDGGSKDRMPLQDHLLDHEIYDLALAHDLPIFVSIDGSLDETGIATFSMTILAPDIKDTDTVNSLNWLDKIAKVLFIRSWRLPRQWGTSSACINMAKSLGFIIGEYIIAENLPIVYITDSYNARTLQKQVRHLNDFTH
jgi:hypothetical protein